MNIALFTGIENSSGIFNFGQDSSFAGTKSSGSAGRQGMQMGWGTFSTHRQVFLPVRF